MSIRRAIDSLKFSKNKLEMIWDEDYKLSNYDKLSCIFPILRFHSRWDKLDESDLRKFVFEGNYTDKGYLLVLACFIISSDISIIFTLHL